MSNLGIDRVVDAKNEMGDNVEVRVIGCLIGDNGITKVLIARTFTRFKNRIVTRVSEVTKTDLSSWGFYISLFQSEAWWIEKYDIKVEDKKTGEYKTPDELTRRAIVSLRDKIFIEAQSKLVLKRLDKKRAGAWTLSNGDIVVNFGDSVGVWKHGDEMVRRGHFYVDADATLFVEDTRKIKVNMLNPMDEKMGRKVVGWFRMWEFDNDASAELAAAFIFLSTISGTLPYRPHMWLCGNLGGYECCLVEDLMPLINGLCLSCSEPLRKNVSGGFRDYSGLFMDSNEIVKPKKVLQLMKEANDDNGNHLCFLLRCSAEKNAHLLNEKAIMKVNLASRSKVIREKIYKDSNATKSRITTKGNTSKFMGRAILQHKTILRNFDQAKQVIGKKVTNHDTINLYSMLVAGYFALIQDAPAPVQQISEYVNVKMTSFL